jgi:hypothetical protein
VDRRGLASRDAAVRARVLKQRDLNPLLPDLTILNLEDLGMSQVEPRPRAARCDRTVSI